MSHGNGSLVIARTYEQNKQIVRDHGVAFLAVGTALLEIKEFRQYKDEYETFEAFCQDNLGMTARNANRLIACGSIAARIASDAAIPPSSVSQVGPLQGLPAIEQAAAWEEACSESDGKAPSMRKVKEVVERRKGTRINGEMVDDPDDVQALRASGKIREDAVIEITGSDSESTTVREVAEECEEQTAKSEDDLSDDDWLARFPLDSQLAGLMHRTFREDALAYRKMRSARDTYKYHLSRLPKPRKTGPWLSSQRFAMSKSSPETWKVCPAPEEGGCGGKGGGDLGQCPKCFGCGYWIPK